MLDTIQIIAAATTQEGAEATGLSALAGQFGINGKIIFAQVINFIVVAFLLWRFAFKPVMETLDERHKKIAEGIRFAEEAKVQLAETEKRQAEVLREANAQAQALLQEARDNSKTFEEKMKSETSKQIEEMRQRAKEANELERQKILGEVRQEIARLVVLTSGKVLQRELPEEEKKRLNSAAVEEIARSN